MPQGTATIDFGAFPGNLEASVDVTGQSAITSGSLAEAWVWPVATADHSADEHRVETLRVMAGNIVAGVGFTIYGVNSNPISEPLEIKHKDMNRVGVSNLHVRGGVVPSVGGRGTRLYGLWTIAWAWN